MIDLRIIETFSGIGCQKRGLENSGVFNVIPVATSDIDKDAIVSYAAIHHGLTEEMVRLYSSYPTREDMVKELTEKNIGYDFMKDKPYDWSKIERKKNQYELCKYWLAMHLQNNLGDISKITELPECDLLTFSFPCQSISLAGKQEGIVENETRSGLVYEIVRLINVAKENNNLPKYLLLENVSNLVAKKFINDFNNLNEFFDEIGYNVYWKVLNAKDCGIPQSRDRVFAIYIRKDIDEIAYEFPKPFYTGLTLKDILEPTLDNVKIVDDTYKNRPVRVYSNYSPSIRSERSGFKVLETVNAYEDGTSRTIKSQYYKTSQANFERTGTFGATGVKEDSVTRKLSPIECFKLMGLTSNDANKCSDVGISSTSLYKQAGNGIVTNCISLLAEHLYKAQYDSEYKCYDERFGDNQ